MAVLFSKILEMSIGASWLVLVVLLLRGILARAPKWIRCLLWAMVAVRLICPIVPVSELSLVPAVSVDDMAGERYSTEDVPIYPESAPNFEFTAETAAVPEPGALPQITVGAAGEESIRNAEAVLPLVWVLGVLAMTGSAFFSYGKIKRKVSASIHLGNEVFLCDYIETPFILGIIRPKIYLPSSMDPNAAAHVLSHERAHIRRRDHWWKPLGFALLTVHWFNPILWLAYILLCRDIELACDEKVIREMEAVDKRAYSQALLSCSVPRHMIAACPLAFGEVGVKTRIKSVLHYRKPGFWVVAGALVVCLVVAVCFLTNPRQKVFGEKFQVTEVVYRNPILSNYVIPKTAPDFFPDEQGILQCNDDENPDTWYPVGPLREIQLTQANFDDYLSWGVGVYRELVELREQNKRTWVASSIAVSVNDIWYLMEQKDGSLYAAVGYNGNINWIYKLGPWQDHDPFAPADSPYQWARNLGTEHLEWVQTTGYDWDGIQRHVMLGWLEQNTLVHTLNNLSADDFSLGRLENERLVTAYFACKPYGEWTSEWDVLLRYDGEAVDMVFRTTNESLYPQENGENWIIRNENLNTFLDQFVQLEQGSNPYLDSETPFQWLKFVSPKTVPFASVSLSEEDTYTRNIFGGELEELLSLLNGVEESQIREYVPVLPDDPVWGTEGVRIWLMNQELNSVLLQCTNGVVFLAPETGSEFWERDGRWVIENPALTQWMEKLSYGGTWMLSEENRAEVRQLLGVNFVEFFDPQSLGSMLYVGCRYADETKLALACFEGNEADGYHLVKLMREADIHKCESGLDLWYADDAGKRIFLVMNRNVTGMKWTGAMEKTITLDRNPAVVAEEFEPGMGASYSFLYGEDGASTLPMPTGVSIVETSWDYGNMRLSIPESWEYEKTPASIAFKPQGEEGWIRLEFMQEQFAVCGTGLETRDVALAGMEATAGYYDGNSQWSYIRIRVDLPGDYVVTNEGQWLENHSAEVSQILNSMVLGEGILPDSQALAIAMEAAEGKAYENWFVQYDFETGVYTVSFHTKKGELVTTIQVDNDGKATELCSLPLAEETQ